MLSNIPLFSSVKSYFGVFCDTTRYGAAFQNGYWPDSLSVSGGRSHQMLIDTVTVYTIGGYYGEQY